MKKLIFLSLVFTAHSISAGSFRLETSCSKAWEKTHAYCIVSNYTGEDIICEGPITARTRSGKLVTEDLEEIILSPGDHQFLDVTTKDYDPFRMITSNIQCETVVY